MFLYNFTDKISEIQKNMVSTNGYGFPLKGYGFSLQVMGFHYMVIFGKIKEVVFSQKIGIFFSKLHVQGSIIDCSIIYRAAETNKLF